MSARPLDGRKFLALAALAAGLLAAVQGCMIAGYSVKLSSLAVTPGTAQVAVPTTQQFAATGSFSDATSSDVTAKVAWSSSDPTVATVDAAGVATPLKAGTTTIIATLSGKSASSSLTVTNALLASIDVTPATPSIQNGTSIQLRALGHFDDGTSHDVTPQATWTSTNANVTVGDATGTKGYATSTALGATTSTIAASITGTSTITGSTTLTVNAVTLTSVAVTAAIAAPYTVKVGKVLQFTATGTFSDATTHDMTGEVAWTSSSPGVATVGATGLATGVSASATPVTITATSSALLGSVPGTASLTVQAATPGY